MPGWDYWGVPNRLNCILVVYSLLYIVAILLMQANRHFQCKDLVCMLSVLMDLYQSKLLSGL